MSGTGCRLFRRSWLVTGIVATASVATVALLGGCEEDPGPLQQPDALATTATPSQATTGETGVGEAPSEVAYTGPYDVELMAVGFGTGRTRTVLLHNRGTRADTYWIEIYPSAAARVSTPSVHLRPDEAATITVMISTRPFVVRVVSRGRKGAEVADLQVR